MASGRGLAWIGGGDGMAPPGDSGAAPRGRPAAALGRVVARLRLSFSRGGGPWKGRAGSARVADARAPDAFVARAPAHRPRLRGNRDAPRPGGRADAAS